MRGAKRVAVRSLIGLVIGVAGCASTPDVRLRVDPARAARLDPAVLRPAETAREAALSDLERDTQRINERLTRAQGALAAARAEGPSPTAEIHHAKVDRAQAEVDREQSLVDGLTWRRAVAEAAYERDKAVILSRTGVDVDLEGYRRQTDRLRAGQREQEARQARARARLDEADRRLNQAKDRYAATRQSSPEPSPR
jgi:multidrug resistance efflux pump